MFSIIGFHIKVLSGIILCIMASEKKIKKKNVKMIFTKKNIIRNGKNGKIANNMKTMATSSRGFE